MGRPGNIIDRHPRASFGALAAVALVVVVLVGVGGALLGGRLQANGDLNARRDRSPLRAPPARFGADLDPFGSRHGGSIRISYVGASVTRGWYVTSQEDSYPAVSARMIARLRQRDVDWHVVALPGAPITVVDAWQPLPVDQDIVVIHVVSDDFLYGTPPPTYEKDYGALLQRIRKSSPKALFVCLGDWGRFGAVNREGMLAYTYEQIVQAVCHQLEGVYVPLNQDYEVPGARGPIGHPSMFGPARGDFHPNDYGDQLIAQSVVAGAQGNPPIEQIPAGAHGPAPEPLLPQAPVGIQPAPVKGHESHRAPGPTPVPERSPVPSPTPS